MATYINWKVATVLGLDEDEILSHIVDLKYIAAKYLLRKEFIKDNLILFDKKYLSINKTTFDGNLDLLSDPVIYDYLDKKIDIF